MSEQAKQTKEPLFGNVLRYVKPFASILPQIVSPVRSVSFQERAIWTILTVLVYLVASQVPLFGIHMHGTKDPLSWLRMMMASSRGTLMDLGVGPVHTSSIVMQGLGAVGIISVDYSLKEDRMLADTLQKLIALALTVGQSVVQIASGHYGAPQSLGFSYCFILFIQLVLAGTLVILLDELLQKGYGLGNGVNLFIVTNVCERILWNALSPKVFFTGRGLEFEGCLVAAVHLLFVRRNKLAALYEMFFRQNLPNLSSLFSTILIFAVVVYLHSIRVELPIISKKYKGVTASYPIRLLYTSSMSVLYQGYVVSGVSLISRFLFSLYPENVFVRYLGVWEACLNRGSVPVSGFCYYIFPPASFKDAFSRPIFFLVYLAFTLASAAWLSYSCIESHNDTAEDVASRIAAQDMQLKGIRDANVVDKLNEYIPIAAILGGICTSAVVVFCDIASTMGSGSNMFLAVSIVNQYMQLLAKETMPRAGKVFID